MRSKEDQAHSEPTVGIIIDRSVALLFCGLSLFTVLACLNIIIVIYFCKITISFASPLLLSHLPIQVRGSQEVLGVRSRSPDRRRVIDTRLVNVARLSQGTRSRSRSAKGSGAVWTTTAAWSVLWAAAGERGRAGLPVSNGGCKRCRRRQWLVQGGQGVHGVQEGGCGVRPETTTTCQFVTSGDGCNFGGGCGAEGE